MKNVELNKIDSIIKEKIRPYLNSHGGDIRVIEFKDRILYVKLLGSCAECLLADETLEEVIRKELTVLEFVDDVVMSNVTDPELIDIAYNILFDNGQNK